MNLNDIINGMNGVLTLDYKKQITEVKSFVVNHKLRKLNLDRHKAICMMLYVNAKEDEKVYYKYNNKWQWDEGLNKLGEMVCHTYPEPQILVIPIIRRFDKISQTEHSGGNSMVIIAPLSKTEQGTYKKFMGIKETYYKVSVLDSLVERALFQGDELNETCHKTLNARHIHDLLNLLTYYHPWHVRTLLKKWQTETIQAMIHADEAKISLLSEQGQIDKKAMNNAEGVYIENLHYTIVPPNLKVFSTNNEMVSIYRHYFNLGGSEAYIEKATFEETEEIVDSIYIFNGTYSIELSSKAKEDDKEMYYEKNKPIWWALIKQFDGSGADNSNLIKSALIASLPESIMELMYQLEEDDEENLAKMFNWLLNYNNHVIPDIYMKPDGEDEYKEFMKKQDKLKQEWEEKEFQKLLSAEEQEKERLEKAEAIRKENSRIHHLIQQSLHNGYLSTQEKIMALLKHYNIFESMYEVVTAELERGPAELDFNRPDPVINPFKEKRIKSLRALQGRKNVTVCYPSGRELEGRMRVTTNDEVVIEPSKGDTAAFICDWNDVKDMGIIHLAEVPHERIFHNESGIAKLKNDFDYINPHDM